MIDSILDRNPCSCDRVTNGRAGVFTFHPSAMSSFDINSVDQYGRTLLLNASKHLRADLVKELLELGADPRCTDDDDSAPLHVACLHGNPDVIRLLLEHGADPLAKNKMGDTPLSIAMHSGHSDVALMLLRHVRGTEPAAADK